MPRSTSARRSAAKRRRAEQEEPGAEASGDYELPPSPARVRGTATSRPAAQRRLHYDDVESGEMEENVQTSATVDDLVRFATLEMRQYRGELDVASHSWRVGYSDPVKWNARKLELERRVVYFSAYLERVDPGNEEVRAAVADATRELASPLR